MDVYLKEEQQLILLPMQHYDLNALEGIGLIHIWWFLVLISMHVLPSKSSTGLLLFMHNSCWVHFTAHFSISTLFWPLAGSREVNWTIWLNHEQHVNDRVRPTVTFLKDLRLVSDPNQMQCQWTHMHERYRASFGSTGNDSSLPRFSPAPSPVPSLASFRGSPSQNLV